MIITAMYCGSEAVWDETAAIAPYRVLCWSPRTKNARANPSKLASFTKKGPRTPGGTGTSQQRKRKNCSVCVENSKGELESGSSEKREGLEATRNLNVNGKRANSSRSKDGSSEKREGL